MKFSRFTFIGLILAIILTVSGCNTANTDGLAATVNGEDITLEEFNEDFDVFRKIYVQQFGEDAMSEEDEEGKTLEESLRENVIEKLIMEKVLMQESEKMNINITPEEVKEPMQQTIDALGGQEEYKKFLESNQISEKFFEENLRKELLVNKHREAFLNDSTIDEEEAKDFFEEYKENLIVVRASHILVKTEDEGKSVIDRLNAGEDFTKLANELSIDKISKEQGGDLGYFARGSMPAEFEDVAFNLNVGETSKLVKGELGYHIIRVEDRKDTYESLKDDMVSLLKENKYMEEINDLRENAKVKIYIEIKDKAK